ncbi:sulfotransferase family 2 domain-containing protein [Marinomonas mediterranea]|uniref:sulfotransferase family 2 domain-containing protein n=1 Tax=Marinomonas mediterranea TaxID=119864 RepID=UPI00234B840A|nr:sulfotransferase family 2 domain-containing protein [Marinomonas mediterranea]WCN11904.1 sulfotransferase family 2 domain-containing protein [Marinomonas mediterranea]
MYISRQHNFIFCHVPRTGGTSLFEHIRQHVKDTERVFLQHLSMKEGKVILGEEFDTFFKFALVRNPWERFVSWYALMALSDVSFDQNRTALNTLPDSPHWQKFDEFLEKASTQKVESFRGNQLFFSQWQQLVDNEDNLLVDEIGRFENYAQDILKFLSKVNVMKPFEENLNGSKHLHYSEYYSDFG